jgi:hypothetical protein
MTDIDLPAGWRQFGGLPPEDYDPSNLDEDILQIRSPGRQFTIDVGWYPAMNPSGEYYCVLISGSDWESPREQYASRDVAAVRDWIVNMVRLYSTLPADVSTVPTGSLLSNYEIAMPGTEARPTAALYERLVSLTLEQMALTDFTREPRRSDRSRENFFRAAG